MSAITDDQLRSAVEAALSTVPDPCMDLAGAPTSIVELGLVRDVSVVDGDVVVVLTFTEMGCAFTHNVLDMVHSRIEAVPGVRSVSTPVAWTPTWSPDDLLAPARRTLADAKERLRERAGRPPQRTPAR